MSQIKQRKEKFIYSGKLEDYQQKLEKEGKLCNKTKYVDYQPKSYSQYQNYLYKRALYGLKAFREDELKDVCDRKKERITKVYIKGQTAINLYKQKLTNVYSNKIFKEFFPDHPITNFFLNNIETDQKFKNTLSFKDLKLNKEKIIIIFIREGVLPKNFYDLKEDPNKLPRLKGESKEENL